MNFLGRKVIFSFHNPHKSDIVIFHKTNSHYITEIILDDLPYFIFEVGPEKIYISPKVLLHFFLSFRLFDWKSVKTCKIKLRKVLKQLRYIYLLACLESIKPKIVISFIDNSSDLHWLSRIFKSGTIFAIQNGNRTNEQLDKRIKQYHKHFFCFGNYERDRYERFGHVVEYFHPVGSLLAGYYKTEKCRGYINIKYDISIISQYSKRLYEKTYLEDRVKWNAMDKMHTFLAKYVNEYNLKAVLLLRKTNPDIDGERVYFDKFYKQNVVYIYNEKKAMSTYMAMDQSEVVVDFFSTASVEAFGWGKKVLHCDFTGTNKYNDYDPMVMFSEQDYETFKKRLHALRSEPYDEYRKRSREYASYVMNNNPDLPPNIYIRKKIEEYL